MYTLWFVIYNKITWSFVVPRFRESVGALILIRLSLCPSVCPSVTNTLSLAITFALLQIELWFLACLFLVPRPFRWNHVVTLTVTFDLLQGQICCRAGDHNSLNLLVSLCTHCNNHLILTFLLFKYTKIICDTKWNRTVLHFKNVACDLKYVACNAKNTGVHGATCNI